MTLTEAECTQKWTEVGSVLKRLEEIVEKLVKQAERSKDADREENARLHAAVAYVMTHLEDIKLKISLQNAEYKDHNINVQLGLLEKYLEKANRGIKSKDQRSIVVNKEAARRTIEYHLEPIEDNKNEN